MDMHLSKLQETVKDREAWCPIVRAVSKSRTQLGNWTISEKKGGMLNFIFSFFLHTEPVLRPPWPLLSGSQTRHAHLYLAITLLPVLGPFFFHFCLLAKSYPFFMVLLIFHLFHDTRNPQWFLSWKNTFIHSFTHSFIHIHYWPTCEYYTVEHLILVL